MKRSNLYLMVSFFLEVFVYTRNHGLAQDEIPRGLRHAWEGFASQVSPAGTYFVRYEIQGGGVGEQVGVWKYPRSSCGGSIRLVSIGDGSATVTEDPPTFNDLGICTYAMNTAQLTLVDGDHLSYDYDDIESTRISGTLIRIQAEFTYVGPGSDGRISVNAASTVPHQGTTILEYAWDFGDGATEVGIEAEHVYERAGRYVVRLTVTNDAFGVDTKEVTVTVFGARFLRGDANGDGRSDMSDAIATLTDLFVGTQEVHCQKAADANDDGTVDLSDAVYLLSHLFLGGPSPSEPIGGCGLDPTPDALSCMSFAGCL